MYLSVLLLKRPKKHVRPFVRKQLSCSYTRVDHCKVRLLYIQRVVCFKLSLGAFEGFSLVSYTI